MENGYKGQEVKCFQNYCAENLSQSAIPKGRKPIVMQPFYFKKGTYLNKLAFAKGRKCWMRGEVQSKKLLNMIHIIHWIICCYLIFWEVPKINFVNFIPSFSYLDLFYFFFKYVTTRREYVMRDGNVLSIILLAFLISDLHSFIFYMRGLIPTKSAYIANRWWLVYHLGIGKCFPDAIFNILMSLNVLWRFAARIGH